MREASHLRENTDPITALRERHGIVNFERMLGPEWELFSREEKAAVLLAWLESAPRQ